MTVIRAAGEHSLLFRPRAVIAGGGSAAPAGVERVRLVLPASGVLLVSLAASAAGPVAFVALTAPQLARRLTESPGPNLLPSMCMGAVLLAAADLTAQRAFPGHELPVGVVTGVLGGGCLVWLPATERRAGRI